MLSNDVPSPQDAFVHGQLLNLVRSRAATTRPALERATGLGRKVVAQRLQQEIDAGLIEDSDLISSGGRPSRTLRFRSDAGFVIAGVIEPTQLRAAIADLEGNVISATHKEWESANRPEETMRALHGIFKRLEKKIHGEPWGIGIGIAGPVDFELGRLMSSPILPGWDGFGVRAWLRDQYEAPVWVDTDVNLMALGEWKKGTPETPETLLYVEMDEGIAAGTIHRGAVLRGDTGVAGNIGHIYVSDEPDLVCRCGKTGCLEAIAGAWAIVDRLSAAVVEGSPLDDQLRREGVITAQGFGLAAAAGDSASRCEIEKAARAVGETVGGIINFLNPSTVVLGGGAIRVGDWVLEAFEESLRQKASAFAQQSLLVRPASLEFEEGLVGAALLAVEQLFGPASIGLWIHNGTPIGRAVALQRSLVV